MFAKTSDELLELIKSHQFVLYIIGSASSGGTTLETCQLIRQFDTKTPIIVNSADAREKSISAAFSAGANEYVIKPNWPELEAAVQRMTTSA